MWNRIILGSQFNFAFGVYTSTYNLYILTFTNVTGGSYEMSIVWVK